MGKSIAFSNDLLLYFFQGSTPSYSQLLSGSNWTSTGWTGSWVAGWTNNTSNTTALTNTLAATSGNFYAISLVVTGMTTGSFTVTFGGVTSSSFSANGTYTSSFQASSSGTFSITPTSAFNGTIFVGVSSSYFYAALHTADPTLSTGTQSASEISYTGYARAAIPRTSVGFTVASNSVSNAALVQLPTCTSSLSPVATFFSIGVLSSGAGEILFSGALSNALGLTVNNGVQPQFGAGTLVATES